ncbi:common central domain of tyrosinase-domain-containing protein [Hyaloscypha finlandica]|nr:common central domain of tyrosinase-domain-containing protein [Hyaloscypha finlandica]
MSAINYPVVGAPKPSPAPVDGSVPLRLEIRQLQQNADQWNLYILGLDAFKKMDETSDLSYYGVCGIHGRPYRPWGGVAGHNNDQAGWQGYCTHSSILFGPWHRPYLALFEQLLYGIVNDIAGQFPVETRARYQAAASTFRIPYWDWAAIPDSGDYFPNAVGGSNTVSVITPKSNGQAVSMPNPLYSTTFHPLNPVQGDFAPLGRTPYNQWPTTLRYPSSTHSLNATSEEDQVFDAMATQFAGLQQNINILMNDPNYKDFSAFSNHLWVPNSVGTEASLEDVHNSIHGAVGGFMGHMSELDYSAFDPVFWLHHCNVDRLFAIWQALNPTSYTIRERTQDGNFVTQAGSVETSSTPLTPFVDASGSTYWTSEGVRRTETFNYAYPETRRWAFTSESVYESNVANAVQQLYGGLSNQFSGEEAFNLMSVRPTDAATAPAIKKKVETSHSASISNRSATGHANGAASGSAQKPIADTSTGFHPFHNIAERVKGAVSGQDPKPEHQAERGGIDFEKEIGKPAAPVPEQPRSYTEYIVNIKAPKHLLGQSYRVHIFLGEFNSDIKTWNTQDALVGTFAVFGKETAPGRDDETKCGKCKDDAEKNTIITGTVPLTAQIIGEVKKSHCGSLDKGNVLPYLKDNLHWRVTLADGMERNRDEVPGLVVSVVSTEVALPEGNRPKYSGVYTVHPEVTAGRPAGLGADAETTPATPGA